jgi:hypothetical protein
METFASSELAGHPDIAFNAGTHTEGIKMACRDFQHLEHSRLMDLTTQPLLSTRPRPPAACNPCTFYVRTDEKCAQGPVCRK